MTPTERLNPTHVPTTCAGIALIVFARSIVLLSVLITAMLPAASPALGQALGAPIGPEFARVNVVCDAILPGTDECIRH